jgi:hypothetical protein
MGERRSGKEASRAGSQKGAEYEKKKAERERTNRLLLIFETR